MRVAPHRPHFETLRNENGPTNACFPHRKHRSCLTLDPAQRNKTPHGCGQPNAQAGDAPDTDAAVIQFRASEVSPGTSWNLKEGTKLGGALIWATLSGACYPPIERVVERVITGKRLFDSAWRDSARNLYLQAERAISSCFPHIHSRFWG